MINDIFLCQFFSEYSNYHTHKDTNIQFDRVISFSRKIESEQERERERYVDKKRWNAIKPENGLKSTIYVYYIVYSYIHSTRFSAVLNNNHNEIEKNKK